MKGRNLTRIKGALFDKDGTLIDFTATWRGLVEGMIATCAGEDAALAADLGAAIGFDPATGLFLPGSPVVAGSTGEVAALMAALLPGTHADEIEREANRRAAAAAGVSPTPGLMAALARLAEMGLTLGVATHDSEAAAHAHTRALGLDGRFAFIAGYDSGCGLKPGPGMVRAFCRATGLSPSDVVMVGDSVHDLGAGRAAGAAAAIGVLTGPAPEAELAPFADAILDAVADLPDFLIRQFPAGAPG
ncbi:HAD family hydrolase [Pikeienuella sp. HZG-20]|uniref:HAD family hydrolase n=1 Tax=Paludibacillus litoralis TaxID=3133267 RepID=UPI0030EE0DCC